MISTSQLAMAFGKKVLFENVSLKLMEGNCYGLIGANGTGRALRPKGPLIDCAPDNGSPYARGVASR